jgi:CRISPR system Cascade subunit CasE
MSALYLSRMMLRKNPAIDALARQILPNDKGDRAHAAHRLVWSAFAGDPDKKRDFLFREMEQGKGSSAARSSFLVLSREPPAADHPLLKIESKTFAPELKKGDRLGFSLRANPTRQTGGKADGRKAIRRDVVMDALKNLKDLPESDRKASRPGLIMQEGYRWLSQRAERSGFRLLAEAPPDIHDDEDEGHALLRIDGYEQLHFARLGRNGRISVLEFDGLLEVTDPTVLLATIASGFGRARAFGCGLMLIRRA